MRAHGVSPILAKKWFASRSWGGRFDGELVGEDCAGEIVCAVY